MTDKTHDQVNGSPPTAEQLAAAWNAALGQYAQGLIAKVQQSGGNLNPFDMLVQTNITALRLNVLIGYLNECAQTQRPFVTAEYDLRAVGALQAAAQSVQQPQILVAAPHSRRQ